MQDERFPEQEENPVPAEPENFEEEPLIQELSFTSKNEETSPEEDTPSAMSLRRSPRTFLKRSPRTFLKRSRKTSPRTSLWTLHPQPPPRARNSCPAFQT